MSKKKEEEFRQLADQALELALSLAKKNKAQGYAAPTFCSRHAACSGGFSLHGLGLERNLQIQAWTHGHSVTSNLMAPAGGRLHMSPNTQRLPTTPRP
jgi:hypothetical protein